MYGNLERDPITRDTDRLDAWREAVTPKGENNNSHDAITWYDWLMLGFILVVFVGVLWRW